MGGNEVEFTTELKPNTTENIIVRGGSYYLCKCLTFYGCTV